MGDITSSMIITKAISDFSNDLALKGYSRELEQEADIIAQLYFKKKDKPVIAMISILDKLAAYTVTREGIILGVSAFSNHPGLLNRIYQVENSNIFKFKEPLILSVFIVNRDDINSGFIELRIDYLFNAPSSDKKDKEVILLIGSLTNSHRFKSFRLDEIKFNFGPTKIVTLEGVRNLFVHNNTSTDITALISISRKNYKKYLEVIQKNGCYQTLSKFLKLSNL